MLSKLNSTNISHQRFYANPTSSEKKYFTNEQIGDSDDEIEDRSELKIFNKEIPVTSHQMTIACAKNGYKVKNIKGDELVRIVHKVTKNFYEGRVEMATMYEREYDGPVTPSPKVENGIININISNFWLLALGRSNTFAPSSEISEYFVQETLNNWRSYKTKKEYFKGIKVANNTFELRKHFNNSEFKYFIMSEVEFDILENKPDGIYKIMSGKDIRSYYQVYKNEILTLNLKPDKNIIDNVYNNQILPYTRISEIFDNTTQGEFALRLHISENYSIGNINVTYINQNEYDNSKRTDLSYSQIVAVINLIKQQYDLSDSNLAYIQLHRLKYPSNFAGGNFMEDKLQEREQLIGFLDYLNCLMFNVEASAINAALVIGVMTLER